MEKQHPFAILVVDDDHDAADSLVLLLRNWGYENCQAVYSGEEGLEAARFSRPSVMLVDLAMPGTTGLGLAQSIRLNPRLKSMALVAISGYAGEEHRRLAREAGFDLLLAKPADPAQLQELLKKEQEKRRQVGQ
jgi:two-component system CheB/CheR fusion protein